LIKTPFFDADAISQAVSLVAFLGLCAYLWFASVKREKAA
jgi:hypothetical protein